MSAENEVTLEEQEVAESVAEQGKAPRSEEDVKSDICDIIREELAGAKSKFPDLFKSKKYIIGQLENITPDQIELYRPEKVSVVYTVEYTLHRYYRSVSRYDGSLGTEYLMNPLTITNQISGNSKPIIVVSDEKNKLQNDWFICALLDYPYVNYDYYMENYSMLEDFRERFEAVYNKEFATKLFNQPEKTTKITFSDWKILEEAAYEVPEKAIIFKTKSPDGIPVKMMLGRYKIASDAISLKGIDDILKLEALDERGQWHDSCKRINPTAIGSFFGAIGDFLRGILECFFG